MRDPEAVFNKQQALTALHKTGKYMCGVNLVWTDLHFMSSINVPLQWSSITGIQKFYFSSPNGFASLPIEIGVLKGQIDASNLGDFGSWRRVSPEESIIAWSLARSCK